MRTYNVTTRDTFNAWKVSNNADGNGISLYVENGCKLYCIFEQLQNQCIKAFQRFGGLDLDYLTNCSSLKAITRAARQRLAGDGESWTMDDDRQARAALARHIFETCEYAA